MRVETVEGAAVRGVRKALGLTQEDLATMSGVDDRTRIAAIEGGRIKAKSPEMRRRLAQGFGLAIGDVADLLEGQLSVDEAVARACPPPKPEKKKPEAA